MFTVADACTPCNGFHRTHTLWEDGASPREHITIAVSHCESIRFGSESESR